MGERKHEILASEVRVGDKLLTCEGAYEVTSVQPLDVSWVDGQKWRRSDGKPVGTHILAGRGYARFSSETVVVLRAES